MFSIKSFSNIATSAVLAIAANTAFAANISTENVYQFGTNQEVGSSTLMRSPTGVSFSVKTHGPHDGSALDNHMTTVWLVVFNDPQYCTAEGGNNGHPACSLDDVMNAMNGGPNEANIDILYGAGNVVGNGSKAHFAGHRRVDDLKKSTFGIGLHIPQEAEIHLVVRSHGPVVAGYGDNRGNVAEAIGNFIGGCGGIPWFAELGVIPVKESECNDIFYSVHLPE